jgi:hypothetical protein
MGFIGDNIKLRESFRLHLTCDRDVPGSNLSEYNLGWGEGWWSRLSPIPPN